MTVSMMGSTTVSTARRAHTQGLAGRRAPAGQGAVRLVPGPPSPRRLGPRRLGPRRLGPAGFALGALALGGGWLGCAAQQQAVPEPHLPAPAPEPLSTRAAAQAAAQAAAPAQTLPASDKTRSADEIMDDFLAATGGRAAYERHTSIRRKVNISFVGAGIEGKLDNIVTSTGKSLTTSELPGQGVIKEGTDGKVWWSQDPINGLRILEDQELEQAKLETAWNPELRLHELYPLIEVRDEVGEEGSKRECLVMTPRLAEPVTNCYDAASHLLVSTRARHATPQGVLPVSVTYSDWREVGGVTMPFLQDSQVGPVQFRWAVTEVKLDEVFDDRTFDIPKPAPAKKPAAPAPGTAAPAKKPASVGGKPVSGHAGKAAKPAAGKTGKPGAKPAAEPAAPEAP